MHLQLHAMYVHAQLTRHSRVILNMFTDPQLLKNFPFIESNVHRHWSLS